MNFSKITLIAVLSIAHPLQAKPLLTSSEETYESVCIDYSDTAERLIDICSRALESNGATLADRLEMMDSLAWAHEGVGDDAKAQAVFEDIYALDPSAAQGLAGLAWMAYGREEYEVAADWFKKALTVAPEEDTLAGLGASLYELGEISLDETIGYLDAALAIDPEYAWAIRQKGWVLEEEGRYDDALSAFEEALTLNPDDFNALYGIGYVHTEDEGWDAALRALNRALQVDPDHPWALSRRSLALLYLDRPAQSLKDGKRVIALMPESSEGYVRVARAEAEMGRGADALSTLEEAVGVVGYDPYLIYWQARFLWNADRASEALDSLGEVFENQDQDYFDHSLLLRILLEQEQFEQARPAVDAALAEYPDAAFLMFYESLVLVGEGDYVAAETRFDEAMAADLPKSQLKRFLKSLVGAAQYVQAVQLRVRYSAMDD